MRRRDLGTCWSTSRRFRGLGPEKTPRKTTALPPGVEPGRRGARGLPLTRRATEAQSLAHRRYTGTNSAPARFRKRTIAAFTRAWILQHIVGVGAMSTHAHPEAMNERCDLPEQLLESQPVPSSRAVDQGGVDHRVAYVAAGLKLVTS